jgi:hypothetical protein
VIGGLAALGLIGAATAANSGKKSSSAAPTPKVPLICRMAVFLVLMPRAELLTMSHRFHSVSSARLYARVPNRPMVKEMRAPRAAIAGDKDQELEIRTRSHDTTDEKKSKGLLFGS